MSGNSSSLLGDSTSPPKGQGVGTTDNTKKVPPSKQSNIIGYGASHAAYRTEKGLVERVYKDAYSPFNFEEFTKASNAVDFLISERERNPILNDILPTVVRPYRDVNVKSKKHSTKTKGMQVTRCLPWHRNEDVTISQFVKNVVALQSSHHEPIGVFDLKVDNVGVNPSTNQYVVIDIDCIAPLNPIYAEVAQFFRRKTRSIKSIPAGTIYGAGRMSASSVTHPFYLEDWAKALRDMNQDEIGMKRQAKLQSEFRLILLYTLNYNLVVTALHLATKIRPASLDNSHWMVEVNNVRHGQRFDILKSEVSKINSKPFRNLYGILMKRIARMQELKDRCSSKVKEDINTFAHFF